MVGSSRRRSGIGLRQTQAATQFRCRSRRAAADVRRRAPTCRSAAVRAEPTGRRRSPSRRAAGSSPAAGERAACLPSRRSGSPRAALRGCLSETAATILSTASGVTFSPVAGAGSPTRAMSSRPLRTSSSARRAGAGSGTISIPGWRAPKAAIARGSTAGIASTTRPSRSLPTVPGRALPRSASGFVRVPEQPACLVEEHRRREAVASASADGRLLALHRMVQHGVRRTSHALCGRCSPDPHYAAHRSALDLVLMTCPNPVGLAVLGLVDG